MIIILINIIIRNTHDNREYASNITLRTIVTQNHKLTTISLFPSNFISWPCALCEKIRIIFTKKLKRNNYLFIDILFEQSSDSCFHYPKLYIILNLYWYWLRYLVGLISGKIHLKRWWLALDLLISLGMT